MKNTRDYLQDMLEYLDNVAAFTTEGRDAFLKDRKTQYAVIRAYEVIGEIAKRLPAELRDANAQINWQILMSFRDFLAHNYERVILNNVWVAIEDLPRLRAMIEALIAALPENDAD